MYTHEQLLSGFEIGTQLSSEIAVGDLEILAQVSVVGHESQISVVDVCQLIVFALHVWNVHIVSGGADIFVSKCKKQTDAERMVWSRVPSRSKDSLLSVKYIDSDHVYFGMSVLSSFGR